MCACRKVELRCVYFAVHKLSSTAEVTSGLLETHNRKYSYSKVFASALHSLAAAESHIYYYYYFLIKTKTLKDEFDYLQDYAENTMNELLGLYGYDKVINSSDTENLNLDRYTSSTPVEGRYSLTDDDTHDDISLDSCDSSSGKSDLSKLGRSKNLDPTNIYRTHFYSSKNYYMYSTRYVF